MPVKKVVKNCLKKMYPKKILHFKIFFVFFMFLLFLLLISVAQNLHDIFIAVGIPAGSTLLVFFEFNRVYKTPLLYNFLINPFVLDTDVSRL